MAKRNCPYCAHSNATDAKFCVACGAAMHLAPCPHCGSINHINVEKCYRCGGDLPKQEVLEGEPEAAPSSAPDAGESGATLEHAAQQAAIDSSPAPMSNSAATVLVREADVQTSRPSLAVMFIIIFSFVFAGLYAARHRGETKDDPAKPAGTAPVQTQATPAATPTATPSPAPQSLPAMPVKAEEEVKVQPEPPKARVEPAKSQSNAKLVAKPTPSDPAKPAAPVTPCTEAVAALGLCKLETK